MEPHILIFIGNITVRINPTLHVLTMIEERPGKLINLFYFLERLNFLD